MEFRIKCDVRPIDFFCMTMKHIYRSPIGMVNIVFTLAMIALTANFWNRVPDWAQLLLGLAVCLFPVIQPIMIFLKSKSQVMAIPRGLELTVDDGGITALLNGQNEKIVWKRVKGLIVEPTMLVLRVDSQNGYFLTNRTLKNNRTELISFLKAHMA